MKNPTSGDFSVMLNSVVAAQSKQTFIYRNWEVNTPGNPLTHTILRGAVNKHGQTIPNYHYEDLIRLYNMYAARDLENPAVIVDANHSNSGKHAKLLGVFLVNIYSCVLDEEHFDCLNTC